MMNVSRREFVGGSDARTITGDDQAKLLLHWEEKRGERPSEDLSGNPIAQLESITQNLNRCWFGRNAGHWRISHSYAR